MPTGENERSSCRPARGGHCGAGGASAVPGLRDDVWTSPRIRAWRPPLFPDSSRQSPAGVATSSPARPTRRACWCSAALVPFLGSNGLLAPAGLGWLATLTLLCGVLRIVFALSGGAVLVRFIPESVLTGFTIGVGILIGVMQLDEALGLPAVNGAGLWDEYRGLTSLVAEGARPSPLAGLVTLVSIAAVGLGQRMWRRLPAALMVVAAAAAAAWALGLDARSGLPLVSDRTAVPGGWPTGALPDLRPAVIASLLVPSAAIVLLGTLELLVSVRADDSRPNVPREILAQGWANVAGSVTAAFPASASLTRSALLRFARPHSRAAAASCSASHAADAAVWLSTDCVHSPGDSGGCSVRHCRRYGEAADGRSRLESFPGEPPAAWHHGRQHPRAAARMGRVRRRWPGPPHPPGSERAPRGSAR